MESITPDKIETGMVIADEVNESCYTVLSAEPTVTGGFYVKTLALTNWGSLIQKNFTYLAEDGELYVVSRPAPFALPTLPTREEISPDEAAYYGSDADASSAHYGDEE